MARESWNRGWGGSGRGGLELCRVKKKLSPGTQESCLSGSCRCSAAAAWGHCSRFPACIKGPVKRGEGAALRRERPALLEGAEEAAGETALCREREAGRGESIAGRESCRQGKAENDKGSQALTRSRCARDLSLSSQPGVPGPARTVLQSV